MPSEVLDGCTATFSELLYAPVFLKPCYAYFCSRIDERDLEDEFRRYGRITGMSMKSGFAFVEFSHTADAEDAIRRT